MTITEPARVSDLEGTVEPQEALTRAVGLLPGAMDALERNLSCGDPAVEVQAARALLVSGLVAETAYSFKGHLSNQTDLTLTLDDDKTKKNGTWVTEPPDTIGPGGSGSWETKYDGFCHDGTVVYTAEVDGGEITMTWKIPLFGNNTIKDDTTISGTTASYEGGRGWHAEVWYYLKQA